MDGGDGACLTLLFQGRQGVRALPIDEDDLLQGFDFAGKVFDLLQNGGLGDEQELDAAVPDDVLPDMEELLFVHGHEAGVQAVGREGCRRPFHPIVGDDPHDIPFADAPSGQASAQVVHPAPEIAIGDPFVPAVGLPRAEQRPVGKARDAALQELDQIVRFLIFVLLHGTSSIEAWIGRLGSNRILCV